MQAHNEPAFALLSIYSTMHKQKKGHSIEVSFLVTPAGFKPTTF